MTTLPIGTLIVAQQATRSELHSARPHAPVVTGPPRPEPRLRRTRTVTASVLHRAASRVSPA
jgi:hypothetical protein